MRKRFVDLFEEARQLDREIAAFFSTVPDHCTCTKNGRCEFCLSKTFPGREDTLAGGEVSRPESVWGHQFKMMEPDE